MKTYKNLFDTIISFDNLLKASKKAQRDKRFRDNVARFNLNLEKNLLELQRELSQQVYQPGSYRCFYIFEPKKRKISAAPYRDRVVHHALCNVIEPIFEKSFIFDSYANRKGKGTHRAVRRFQTYLQKYEYVLKCDLKKYFPSIDHQILKQKIRKKIGDDQALWLIDTIIDNSNLQDEVIDYFPGDDLFTPWEKRRGLPIGNLTSQFFSNVYLNDFDHFVKEKLRCKAYERYVDDFVLLDNDKSLLKEMGNKASEFLLNSRLKIHPKKFQIFLKNQGIDFLGYLVFPTHIKLRKTNALRFRRKLKKMSAKYRAKKIELNKVSESVQGWLGHACFANTYNLRRSIFSQISFQRN